MRSRPRRVPLPARAVGTQPSALDFSHDDLVAALAALAGMVDTGARDRPIFEFRGRPFLHFHDSPEGVYADVRFGSGDFEPVWAATALERRALLARVADHCEAITDRRKDRGRQPRRRRPDRR